MKITTKSGFTCDTAPGAENDFRILEVLSDMTGGGPVEKALAYPRLVRLLLGQEGARQLYLHIAPQGGAVATDRAIAEITEIFAAMYNAKNS